MFRLADGLYPDGAVVLAAAVCVSALGAQELDALELNALAVLAPDLHSDATVVGASALDALASVLPGPVVSMAEAPASDVLGSRARAGCVRETDQ